MSSQQRQGSGQGPVTVLDLQGSSLQRQEQREQTGLGGPEGGTGSREESRKLPKVGTGCGRQ